MKPKPTQEAPIANVWSVNLQAVLLSMVRDGEHRVTLELASEPDATGNVRLLVRRVADGGASQPPPRPALAPHDPLVLTCGRPNLYAMREACKP